MLTGAGAVVNGHGIFFRCVVVLGRLATYYFSLYLHCSFGTRLDARRSSFWKHSAAYQHWCVLFNYLDFTWLIWIFFSLFSGLQLTQSSEIIFVDSEGIVFVPFRKLFSPPLSLCYDEPFEFLLSPKSLGTYLYNYAVWQFYVTLSTNWIEYRSYVLIKTRAPGGKVTCLYLNGFKKSLVPVFSEKM